MDKCITFAIWLLLVISFLSSVNSQKTRTELSNAERIPREIFMKDEPRRQDSNEKSLRAMHLCMEEEDGKEQLITCDRRYSSKFACVGDLEGNIQKCDKFNEEQRVALAICVQVESSYILICDHRNQTSHYLCSSRKLTWMIDYYQYNNSTKLSTGLRKGIRQCDNKQGRICLEKGALFPCGYIAQVESEMDENDKIFVMNISRQKNSENEDSPKSVQREIDRLQFQDGILNLPNHISVVPNKGAYNHTFKYKTVNILSPKTGVSKFLNSPETQISFKLNSDSKESSLNKIEPISRSDIPLSPYALPEASRKYEVNSKFNYKAVNAVPPQRDVSKFSDRYKYAYAFESTSAFIESGSREREFPFPSEQPDMRYHSSISDKGKINPIMKYKKINILSRQQGFSKFKNLDEKSGFLETPNLQESADGLKLSEEITRYTSNESKLLEEKKESSSRKMESAIYKDWKEPEFVTDNFETLFGLNRDQLEQKYKMASSATTEPIDSSPSDASRVKAGWESQKQKLEHGITKQSKKGRTIPENSSEVKIKAPAKPAHTYGTLFRSPGKRRHVKETRKQSSQTKRYFYVLKCKDCDIQHVMLVDKDAEDVIPEVEIWTFKP